MDEHFFTDPRTEQEVPPPAPETEPAAAEDAMTAEPAADLSNAFEDEDSHALEDDTIEGDDTGDVDENEPDPLAGAFQYYAPEQPKKSNWPIIVLAILLVVVFVGGLLWAFGVFRSKEAEGGGTEIGTSEGSGTDFGTKDVSDLIAAESADLQVTNGMFSFNMESTYLNFQSQYSYALSSMGLDTSISTKEQTAYTGDGTWFDFFKNYALADAEWMLVLSQAAKTEGTTMDDTIKAQLENYLESLDLSGFHNGVTKEDARAFLEMYYTALAHEDALFNAATFTADEVQAHYEANKTTYDLCDIAYFTFSIGEEGDFATVDEATDTVKSLAECSSPKAFKDAVVAYLVESGAYEAEEAGQVYDETCLQSGIAYSEEDEVCKWLFAADTAVGDTKTVENESTIAVYMMTGAPARDTTKTVNVRHILFTADTYGSDDDARTKANEVLNEWSSGEATAASFGELAAQYTEDSNGAAGGLYEGVTQGQMVTEFNDWCFDEARRSGDTGVVKTTYGYHVMYFEGVQETWYGTVLSTLKEESCAAQYEEYRKQYPVTFHNDNIDQNDM